MMDSSSPNHPPICAGPIARQRIERGMSQKQLALLIGKRQKDVSRWENGTHRPNAQSLILLSKALECSIDELMKD